MSSEGKFQRAATPDEALRKFENWAHEDGEKP